MKPAATVPVLEVGGTHVAAALVDVGAGDLVDGSRTIGPLDADGSAAELLDAIAAAANRLQVERPTDWVVAMPGPFDYERGVGLFRDVGKFDRLGGVDVGRGLASRIRARPAAVRFLNDADAFGVGEYVSGAARGHDRALCLTLGTGVGSAFLDRGRPVHSGPTVPPEGHIYRVVHDGRPLEETVSRRAIRTAYAAGPGRAEADDGTPDVQVIADRCRQGDAWARAVLERAFRGLGAALAPLVERFEASIVVVGGAITGSWDLLEPAVRHGLSETAPALDGLAVRPAERNDRAALLGAAAWSLSPPG